MATLLPLQILVWALVLTVLARGRSLAGGVWIMLWASLSYALEVVTGLRLPAELAVIMILGATLLYVAFGAAAVILRRAIVASAFAVASLLVVIDLSAASNGTSAIISPRGDILAASPSPPRATARTTARTTAVTIATTTAKATACATAWAPFACALGIDACGSASRKGHSHQHVLPAAIA